MVCSDQSRIQLEKVLGKNVSNKSFQGHRKKLVRVVSDFHGGNIRFEMIKDEH